MKEYRLIKTKSSQRNSRLRKNNHMTGIGIRTRKANIHNLNLEDNFISEV